MWVLWPAFEESRNGVLKFHPDWVELPQPDKIRTPPLFWVLYNPWYGLATNRGLHPPTKKRASPQGPKTSELAKQSSHCLVPCQEYGKAYTRRDREVAGARRPRGVKGLVGDSLLSGTSGTDVFSFFLVAAPLKMVQAPKRVPCFFSRVTEELSLSRKKWNLTRRAVFLRVLVGSEWTGGSLSFPRIGGLDWWELGI